jgi:WD40 repeat protein
VALGGDGKHVVTGSEDKTAILWEAASDKKLQTFQGHTISSVTLSGDTKHVVTGDNDKTAILWEAASDKKLQTFQGHTSAVTSVALSGDGKHVLTGHRTRQRSYGRRPAARNSRPSTCTPPWS